MVEEIKKEVDIDPNADPSKENKGDEKPTLESITKQMAEQNDKLEKVLKQNADKDSFITKLQTENKELRGQVEKISSTLMGKTEKQKDTILEKHRQALIDKGYDAESVSLLLSAVEEIADAKADKKTSERIVPIVLDTVEELIDSDMEIDKKLVKEYEKEIWEEYESFKVEITPRKIKSNFKKAYNTVKDKLAKKAKAEDKAESEEARNNRLKGAGAPPQGGKEMLDEEKRFVESIEKSNSANSRFI